MKKTLKYYVIKLFLGGLTALTIIGFISLILHLLDGNIPNYTF
jgi:hypothetical protein